MNAKTTLPAHASKKSLSKGDSKEIVMNNSRIVMVFNGQHWVNTQVKPV